MKAKQGFTLVDLIYVVVILAALVGWVLNIVDILAVVNDPITPMFILRIVGIFIFPLGAVLGYF